MTDEQTARQKP